MMIDHCRNRWCMGALCLLVACAREPQPSGAAANDANAAGAAGSSADFNASLQALGERYGVEIRWQGGPYAYTYDWGGGQADDATADEVAVFAPLLHDELSLYPEDFLQRVGIGRILLTRDVALEQRGVKQNVSGYIFDRDLVLSVVFNEKVNHPHKQRRYLHHLIWHLVDGVQDRMWDDPAWVALNPPGFEYGVHTAGGIHDRTSETGLLSTQYPGFLNRYGTGNVPDDKADLFAYLMVVHHWVMQRTVEDDYLRAKAAMIKARLAEFDPRLDADFWARIDAIRRDVAPYMTP